jgi:predicted nucleic acid-binding protein
VPLLVEEPSTARLRELYREDAEVAVAWTTPVECASALARLERDGALGSPEVAAAFRRLDALAPSWLEVEPADELRELARRLLRVHPLRAADALQLASAVLAAERRPPSLSLVTLDDRLAEAAAREGFQVVAMQS